MQNDGLKKGDTVVVTGASQGIGRAIAIRLAKAGAKLILWDIAAEGLQETAQFCTSLGLEATTFVVDIGTPKAIEDAGKAVVERFGAPFGLVNNAAVFPRSFVLETDPAEWDQVIRVNLTGPFLCTRVLGPSMIARGRGAIVNISSTVPLRGDPNGAHYASAKAGLLGLTKSLSLAMAPKGVRVNCVMPGIAETAQPLVAMTRDQLIARGKDIPLGRIGQPEDIAAMVAFLLSSDAGYVTGQSISVNGGAVAVP